MSTIVGHALFLSFDFNNDRVNLAGGLYYDDGAYLFGATSGGMPCAIGTRILEAADKAGVHKAAIADHPGHSIIALIWGQFPIEGRWDEISKAIALSATIASFPEPFRDDVRIILDDLVNKGQLPF